MATNIVLSDTVPPSLAEPTFTITYSEGVFTVTPSLPSGATGYDIQVADSSSALASAPVLGYPSAATPHLVRQSTGTLWARIRATTTALTAWRSDWTDPDSEVATGFTKSRLTPLGFTLTSPGTGGSFTIRVNAEQLHPAAGTWEYRYIAAGTGDVTMQVAESVSVSTIEERVSAPSMTAVTYQVQVRQVPSASSLARFDPSIWSNIGTIDVAAGTDDMGPDTGDIVVLAALTPGFNFGDNGVTVTRPTLHEEATSWVIQLATNSHFADAITTIMPPTESSRFFETIPGVTQFIRIQQRTTSVGYRSGAWGETVSGSASRLLSTPLFVFRGATVGGLISSVRLPPEATGYEYRWAATREEVVDATINGISGSGSAPVVFTGTAYAQIRATGREGRDPSPWTTVRSATLVALPEPPVLNLRVEDSTITVYRGDLADNATMWAVRYGIEGYGNLVDKTPVEDTHVIEDVITGQTYYLAIRQTLGTNPPTESLWAASSILVTETLDTPTPILTGRGRGVYLEPGLTDLATGYDYRFATTEAGLGAAAVQSVDNAQPVTIDQSTGTVFVQVRATSTHPGFLISEWSDTVSEAVIVPVALAVPAFTLEGVPQGVAIHPTPVPNATGYQYRYASTSGVVADARIHDVEGFVEANAYQLSGTVHVQIRAVSTALEYLPSPWSAIDDEDVLRAITTLGAISFDMEDFFRGRPIGTGKDIGVDVSNIVLPNGATDFQYQHADSSAGLTSAAVQDGVYNTNFAVYQESGTVFLRLRAISNRVGFATGNWVPDSEALVIPPKLMVPTFTLTPASDGITVTPALPAGSEGYLIYWGDSTANVRTNLIVRNDTNAYKIRLGEGTAYVIIKAATSADTNQDSEWTVDQNATVLEPVSLEAPESFTLARTATGVSITMPTAPMGATGYDYRISSNPLSLISVPAVSVSSPTEVTNLDTEARAVYAQVRWTSDSLRRSASLWSEPEYLALDGLRVPLMRLRGTSTTSTFQLTAITLDPLADSFQYQQATTEAGVASADIETSSFGRRYEVIDRMGTGSNWVRYRAYISSTMQFSAWGPALLVAEPNLFYEDFNWTIRATRGATSTTIAVNTVAVRFGGADSVDWQWSTSADGTTPTTGNESSSPRSFNITAATTEDVYVRVRARGPNGVGAWSWWSRAPVAG